MVHDLKRPREKTARKDREKKQEKTLCHGKRKQLKKRFHFFSRFL